MIFHSIPIVGARRAALTALVVAATLLTGCATTRERAGDVASDMAGSVRSQFAKYDPFEPVNRVIYQVNDKLDKAVIKPIAEGYKAVLPTRVRYCISNVFGNIGDVPTSLNNFLQGKIEEGGSDLCRVAINSTIGIFGCFDVAAKWGFDKHNEDFGQTLGRWGIPTGPYIVLPLLGPSSLRDAAALLVVDARIDPMRYINDIPVRNELYGVRLVDKRAQLLDTTNLLETAALDPYVFIRDAYLARRRSLVFDGNAPPPTEAESGQPTSAAPQPAPNDGNSEAPKPRSGSAPAKP